MAKCNVDCISVPGEVVQQVSETVHRFLIIVIATLQFINVDIRLHDRTGVAGLLGNFYRLIVGILGLRPAVLLVIGYSQVIPAPVAEVAVSVGIFRSNCITEMLFSQQKPGFIVRRKAEQVVCFRHHRINTLVGCIKTQFTSFPVSIICSVWQL